MEWTISQKTLTKKKVDICNDKQQAACTACEYEGLKDLTYVPLIISVFFSGSALIYYQ